MGTASFQDDEVMALDDINIPECVTPLAYLRKFLPNQGAPSFSFNNESVQDVSFRTSSAHAMQKVTKKS